MTEEYQAPNPKMFVRRGEGHPNAKLTKKEVLRIRYLRAKGHSLLDLADTFDVHPSYISAIARRETWRHI